MLHREQMISGSVKKVTPRMVVMQKKLAPATRVPLGADKIASPLPKDVPSRAPESRWAGPTNVLNASNTIFRVRFGRVRERL